MTITLPWPPRGLNPNARLHWRAKNRVASRYRQDCHYACLAAGVRRLDADRAAVSITFHPPDARRRDMDNMLASIKAGLDVVSQKTGVDDSRFDLTLARSCARPGGQVVVVLEVGA